MQVVPFRSSPEIASKSPKARAWLKSGAGLRRSVNCVRDHSIRLGAAPALALVLAASWMSVSEAQTQSEPPVSYDGGPCSGVMKVQDAKIRCNKGFRISSELYDGPSTIVLSGSTPKSTYLFRLISPANTA